MLGDDPKSGRPQPAATAPRRSRSLVITAGVLLAAFLLFTGFASFWTERLWFGSLGYGDVFSKLVWTRIGLFAVFGALMAATVALNMYLAHRFRPFFRPTSMEQDNLERYRGAVAPIRRWLLLGVAVLMGVFAGTSAAGQWRQYSLWRNGVSFGEKDPYFHRDVGFYVFDLPWWHYVVDFTMAIAMIGLITAAVVHYLYGGIRLQASSDRLSRAAQAQFSALVGVFVLAKAADYWLDRFDLLSDSGNLITGMNYTDDRAVLPAKNILMGIAVICAILFFLNVWRRTWMLPTLGVGLLALSAILLGLIWPGVVQRFQVTPSEADKEAPYIEKNIDATRAAYDVEDVDEQPFTSSSASDAANLASLEAATASVPLVDPQQVRDSFEQLQQVRAYYSVAPVLDVDRYGTGADQRALVLGVRELDQAGLDDDDKNWSNLHTVYTHGNGVIAAYANQRAEDNQSQRTEVQWAEGGEPDETALTDLPPEPYETRVYYGEQSPSYSIVGRDPDGKAVELDLPRGERDDDNTTTSYDGAGGVPVGGLFNKLLYATKFGEPNLVLSSRVHEDSKILYDRNPRTMVEKVAPWLTVDADPYPAVIDGRIQWILDGYTTTDQYPLSQRASFTTMTDDSLQQQTGFQTLPTDDINYMRNAVKATVDAYDGTVRLYAWDEEDPMLKAWRSIFPGVVQDKSEISDGLMEHLRYPEDLFKVQRYQYARYHVTDAKDWYEGNNRWQVPFDPNDDSDTKYQPPYRLFVNPPGTESPADQVYSLTSVYVPRNKNNLAAFVSVDSDATSPDYGKIRALELPNEATSGPGQIANEFAADESVRAELLKFEQGGRRPIYGNMLTLPVGDGLMYVQPLYAAQSGSDASYPILQYVLVSYDGSVGIATTLTGAIESALSGEPSTETPPTPPTGEPTEEPTEEPSGDPTEEPTQPPTGTLNQRVGQLLERAEDKFAEADRLQQQGDTVGWAKALDEARDLVKQAVQIAGRTPKP
ncbi:UPF0182 family protein [Nocardioides sp. LHG3406-4]|uniref:UPF0182 family membrane protein n=1 Tax=Nocardioides sp. LHG3406-4 TaxID=2804575 RepID=UPI003CF0D110